jgi:hypothetical protein
MNEPQWRAQHPLDAQQKAHHVMQMCAAVLGLFLWLAWYFGWPAAGFILPFIGNPIVNTATQLLPADVQLVFNNSLVAGAFAAAAVAGAAWILGIVLFYESLVRWFEEEELKKIEAQARRLQAARERLERRKR